MITNIIAFALDVKNYFRYCLSQLITNQTTRRNRVMEIPKFLIEMSEQMNNEDNRCTADPIWMVVHDNWLTCADDRGDKNILLLCNGGDHYIECDEDDYTEIFTYLKEDHEEWCMELIREHDEEEDDIDELSNWFDPDDVFQSLPENVTIEKLAMQKEMKVINSHLTEEGAKQFIARKQHDYPKLYTYVYSMYHCNQMKELRAWIKSINNGDSNNG